MDLHAGVAGWWHTIVATETDLAGHTGNASVAFTLDTAAPTVSSVIDAPANGDLGIGSTVTLTMAMNEAVTVSGAPSLLLNNGGTAKYVSGSGGSALTFSYTVGSGQSTSDLAVKSVNLAAGAITDLAGNTGILSGAAVNPAGRLIIDTTSVRAGLVGSPANTTLVGTNAASVFDISAGGATYSVTGGSGNDMIVAGQSLIATDTINGGGGSNSMLLWGDYSGGLTLGPSTVTNVQTFTFADGFNYALTLNAATVASGKSLTLDASTLAPINAATLDGSGVGAGRTLSCLGGSGNDVLTGGGGTNQMYGGAGADVMNAGAGADVFLYRAATDSPFGGPDDMIAGFVPGTDKIDLRALLLTNKTVLDVASGSFSGNFAGNGVAIDYGVGGAGTAQVYVDANKSGSLGSGDMLINVTGVAAHSLTGSSFLM
jgi:large repetitive protein